MRATVRADAFDDTVTSERGRLGDDRETARH